ncbi:helix-turn-helix transcriptional regulator [Sedimentibacter hydroxybenzoicus DSM 7310]|uniref:Helix-turn-helix transcriptional regulator n=1 Tax=Sedimentibacter hydroxybenzoicus DSM 7310 TaxID=1123245 RepID=A0A974BGK7_SEDHY|nr:XRE family transcriptional regulator [Sedimentibacter hydroxybenzoicus]NYB72735.1 helix-turn-helix transcriptional regulator [Sedimentibacter hydroxybenzoicus DSM 7310]
MNIGENLKRLRIANSLTQQELADRCELTKGYISQLERDLTSPSIATLTDILECLGTDLGSFFNEAVDIKIVFKEEDVFVKESDDNYKINWIVPNAQKNKMEPILVELGANSKTKEDEPHEGEEFGYVLSGTIMLNYGNQIYKVKKGESFYIKANKTHFIENTSKNPARVIWVSTPPNF